MYAPQGSTVMVLTTNLSFPDLVSVLAELQQELR
jgi:hypothetical protein